MVVKCEKCQIVDTSGAKYFFFYGTFIRAEDIGNNRTRYDFKIAGSKDVFLCDKCVSEFAKKKMQRISLGILVGMVVSGVGIPVGQYLSNIKSGGVEQTVFPYFIIVFTLILAIGSYFWLQRQVRRQLLSQGDMLAIKLRKPGLKSQGYTRFYTREKMQKNQLL